MEIEQVLPYMHRAAVKFIVPLVSKAWRLRAHQAMVRPASIEDFVMYAYSSKKDDHMIDWFIDTYNMPVRTFSRRISHVMYLSWSTKEICDHTKYYDAPHDHPYAAKMGQFDIIKHSIQQITSNPDIFTKVLISAYKGGQLDIAKYLLSNAKQPQISLNKRSIRLIAQYCDERVINLVGSQLIISGFATMFKYAFKYRNTNALEALRKCNLFEMYYFNFIALKNDRMDLFSYDYHNLDETSRYYPMVNMIHQKFVTPRIVKYAANAKRYDIIRHLVPEISTASDTSIVYEYCAQMIEHKTWCLVDCISKFANYISLHDLISLIKRSNHSNELTFKCSIACKDEDKRIYIIEQCKHVSTVDIQMAWKAAISRGYSERTFDAMMTNQPMDKLYDLCKLSVECIDERSFAFVAKKLDEFPIELVLMAARCDFTSILEYAKKRVDYINHVAKVCGYEITKRLHELGIASPSNTANLIKRAIKEGNSNFIEWAIAQKIRIGVDECEFAARCGHSNVFRLIAMQYESLGYSNARECAAACGHYHIVDWIDKKQNKVSASYTSVIIRDGKVYH